MEPGAPSDEARALLVKLEKARRTLRLYGVSNAVVVQMVDDLTVTLESHLARHGPCELKVQEDGLWLGEDQVLADGRDPQGLAFLLFRDGVRGLTLLPGLDQAQVRGFLECVNRVSLPSSDDDLVTLLWDMDLQAVRTVVVEDLESDTPEGGEAEQAEPPAGFVGSVTVRVEDLKAPVARLPAHECRLTDSDLERLQAELIAEEREDPLPTTLDLVLELVLLDPDEEDWRAAVGVGRAALERALDRGALGQVAGAVTDLRQTARACPDRPAAARLVDTLERDLAASSLLGPTLEAVAAGRAAVTPDELRAFLDLIAPRSLPTVLSWIPRLPEGELRRVATAVAMSPAAGGVDALLAQLPPDPGTRTAVLGEVLLAARQHDPATAAAVARSALDQGGPDLRRQAAAALGPHQDGAVGDLWLELLADDDPELRRLAVAALVRTGRPELAQPIADQTLTHDFAARPFDEKQRFFIAVARLGGDRCLPWFASLLDRPLPRWFVPGAHRDTVAAVVSGLVAVRSPAGRALLERLSKSRERTVRTACREALKGRGGHGDS